MSKKDTLENCQKTASLKDGLCLSKLYLNNRDKMEWQCNKGHIWSTSHSHIKFSNSWCPQCSGNLNNSIELCHKIATSNNGRCLSDQYINALTKMEWECQNKHIWFATFNKIKSLHRWCPYCAGVAKLSIQECTDLAISRNGKCLSAEYLNAKAPIQWQCGDEHIWEASFGVIKYNNQWCPICAGKRITIDDCQKVALLKDGLCLSNEYINSDNKLLWKCKKDHIWAASFNNIKNADTWCPKCAFNAPRAQQEIEIFINSLGLNTIFNERSIIKPKHLDIFIPSKNIAIEYCGLYWHGEKVCNSEARNKHIIKLNLCKEKNIKLITIFEDEWLHKKEQTKGYLKAIFGKTEIKIDARKCVIEIIDNSIANVFHSNNHIQGNANGKHYGLYYNNELVCISTFAKLGASRNAFRNSKNKIELMRYTVKINYSVRGGLGKLLSHFKKQHPDIKTIISYSDNRWSSGNIYKTLGFELINTGSPSYHYFKDKKYFRHHRYNFTKHRALQLFGGDPLVDTEWSIMSRNGYDRIWDCGSSKWVLVTND